jgi:hypothetical protein
MQSNLSLSSHFVFCWGCLTGASAAPRGQCRLAACLGVLQGTLPVSGMPWGSDPPLAGSTSVAASLALITVRSRPLLLRIWSGFGISALLLRVAAWRANDLWPRTRHLLYLTGRSSSFSPTTSSIPATAAPSLPLRKSITPRAFDIRRQSFPPAHTTV